MPLRAEDVQAQTFQEKRKGYDVDQVDAFLERVAESLRELHDERETLVRRVAEQPPRTAEPDSSDLLTRTLLTAQRAADETLADAKAEADRLLRDARSHAGQLLDDAEQRIAADRDVVEAEAARVARAAEGLVRFRDEYRGRVQAVIAEQLALLEQAGDLPDVPQAIRDLATFSAATTGLPAQAAQAPAAQAPQSALQGESPSDPQTADRHAGDF